MHSLDTYSNNKNEDATMQRLPGIAALILSAMLSGNVSAACNNPTTYAKTKYPIVLVPGGFGFVNLGGVLPYFYQIPEDLRCNGATVLTPEFSALATSEQRGEQLRAYLETYFALNPQVEKVNLQSHSQGAGTIRYVAATMPGRVASVTAVAGNVNGNYVAQLYTDSANKLGLAGDFVDWAVQEIGGALGILIGYLSAGEMLPQDTLGTIHEISMDGMAAFNIRFPAGVPATRCGQGAALVDGVHYFSWIGNATMTNLLDPTNYFPVLDWLNRSISKQVTGVTEVTDSVVGQCESHLGKVIRDDYRMNHFDEVNQAFGLVDVFAVNPKTVWKQHANRLKKMGL